MQLKRFGINISLIIGSTLFSILVAETFFYFLGKFQQGYPGIYYQTEDSRIILLCYDDHFNGTPDWDLRRDRPFAELTNIANTDDDSRSYKVEPENVPNATEIKLNKFKFRERSFEEIDRAGVQASMTLVVGDSFCFGQGVRAGDRFSNILESKLNSSRKNSAGEKHLVINTCIPGMNIGRIPMVTKQIIGRFRNIRRVVYSYTLNDPIRDKRMRETQKMLNDFGSKWIPGDDWAHLRDDPMFEGFQSVLSRWRSHTISWFTERMARNQVSEDTIEWYRRMYTDNEGWGQTKDLIVEMHEFCKARNVEMTLAVFPLFINLEDYPLVEAHRILGQFARQQGIHHLDLLEIFAGKNEMDYWVHPKDFHPNSRAHREAADFLYSEITW